MRILVLTVYILTMMLVDGQRKAFVNPQSDCRVKCMNGGFCAYMVDNPSVHTCLCLLNMFYGDLCQYQVTESTTAGFQSTKFTSNVHDFVSNEQQLSPDYGESSNFDEKSLHKSGSDGSAKKIENEKTRKKEEDDYTEGWNTGTSDEYAYEDKAETNDIASSSMVTPVWLRDTNEFDLKHMHRAHSHITKDKSQTVLELERNSIDDYGVGADINKHKGGVGSHSGQNVIEEMRKNSDGDDSDIFDDENDDGDNFNEMDKMDLEHSKLSANGKKASGSTKSNELIPESESEDDGWMMSKRRRVITNDCNHRSISMQSVFIPLILLLHASITNVYR